MYTRVHIHRESRSLAFAIDARGGRDSQPIADDDGSVDIKDMSTSQRQRYFETEKENRVKQLGSTSQESSSGKYGCSW